jgi:hypothetical protein
LHRFVPSAGPDVESPINRTAFARFRQSSPSRFRFRKEFYSRAALVGTVPQNFSTRSNDQRCTKTQTPSCLSGVAVVMSCTHNARSRGSAIDFHDGVSRNRIPEFLIQFRSDNECSTWHRLSTSDAGIRTPLNDGKQFPIESWLRDLGQRVEMLADANAR